MTRFIVKPNKTIKEIIGGVKDVVKLPPASSAMYAIEIEKDKDYIVVANDRSICIDDLVNSNAFESGRIDIVRSS